MNVLFFPFLFTKTALFMIRDSSFLKSVPVQYHKDFVDVNPVAPAKLQMLKQMLKERFGVRGEALYSFNLV